MSKQVINLSKDEIQEALVQYAIRKYGFRPTHVGFCYNLKGVHGGTVESDGSEGYGYLGKPNKQS